MARQVDLIKQQRWLKLHERWAKSRLCVRDFCERHGLTEASFYFWRRVLLRRGLLVEPTANTTAPSAATVATAFVQLAVAPPTPTATGSAIDIVLGNQRRLRVRPGFDADTLCQLVRLLEESADASEVPPC